jgi:hypothetical protein
MENSKVKLSGESYFRFRNRWPDCKSGNVSSGNTIAAQRCWSDVRVERQPGEAISPQVIVLPHDKRYVAPLSGNTITAQQCWSDVRVERQPGEAISPQVIVLPHDKRYIAPLSGNCIAARNTRQFAIAV